MLQRYTDNSPSKRAVFLDRDGVINAATVKDGRTYAPSSLAQFRILSGVPQAVRSLRAAGFMVIVATNQPDMAKNKRQKLVIEKMHQHLQDVLPVDEIRVCAHVDEDHCICRKPKPGLLKEAATSWEIDLHQSFMVGDTWRDIGAGKAAGCTTILIANPFAGQLTASPDHIASTLLEASDFIIAYEGNKTSQ